MTTTVHTNLNGATGALNNLLEMAVSQGGADLLLVAGVPPCVRVDGNLRRMESAALTDHDIETLIVPALTPSALKTFRDCNITDCSYRVPELGRFRINLHRERGRTAAAIRFLPKSVPSFEDLHLPASMSALADLPRGLVIIGGPAGSGKTTTVAALVGKINQSRAHHIITIEDPIEYEHAHGSSIIEQVEVGLDAPDFPTALRSALRQSPDVLVVGEMRDPETIRTAVVAAETGHLVFSTLHTTDIASTISRISDSFPAERQNTIRQELAMTLAAVSTQQLLPSKRGGLIPAAELLMIGYGARQHIRRNALQHLIQEIAITRKNGSFSLEESLARLMREGHIDHELAVHYANHVDDLNCLLK